MGDEELEDVISETGMERRAFMRKLVAGSVFAVPVVSSFAMGGIEAASASAHGMGNGNQTIGNPNQPIYGPNQTGGPPPIYSPNQDGGLPSEQYLLRYIQALLRWLGLAR